MERNTHPRRQRERTFGSFELKAGEHSLRFRTQPGVFSQDGPDEGTRLLLDVVLPRVKPHHTVIDLGTGVGVIGLSLAMNLDRGDVWMVDSDIRAVRLAEFNAEQNRIENAHVVLSDISLDLPKLRADLVVSNPPTHSGKEVLSSFVSESYDILRPGGWLYLVVNRLLSVRDLMAATFGEAEQVERRKGFIVFRAQKPRKRHVEV